jgi:hypothetical protein
MPDEQQQQVVDMRQFIKQIDTSIGDHLESPTLKTGDNKNRILDIIRQALESPNSNVMATRIKEFYDGPRFTLQDYNKLLDEDEEQMTTKKPWGGLNIEEKSNVGFLAHQDKVILIH